MGLMPGFRPLTRIHLLLTRLTKLTGTMAVGFRPLTRIHLLLTLMITLFVQLVSKFPTSDEDSSTPDY